MSAGPDGLKFGGSRLSVLAGSIRNSAGRFIVDKTGLEGFYEFTLQFAGERAVAQGTAGDQPDLFTALQEQLGLRLRPDRALLRWVVVDAIERPTEN
jgi:uncharacterized protein (TIGR03435 family)